MFKDKRVKLIIFLSLIVGILLSIKLIIPREIKLEITETSPKDNQEQTPIGSSLIFTFNQPVLSENFIVLPFPDFKYTLVNKDEYSLEIKPAFLEYETEYQVELKNKEYENFYAVLNFKTEKIKEESKYNQEEAKKFYEQLEKETYEDYPLFDHIPYYGKDFSIDYLKPLTLEVILKKETPETREEALEWIRSKGIDPSTHKIEWKYQP